MNLVYYDSAKSATLWCATKPMKFVKITGILAMFVVLLIAVYNISQVFTGSAPELRYVVSKGISLDLNPAEVVPYDKDAIVTSADTKVYAHFYVKTNRPPFDCEYSWFDSQGVVESGVARCQNGFNHVELEQPNGFRLGTNTVAITETVSSKTLTKISFVVAD